MNTVSKPGYGSIFAICALALIFCSTGCKQYTNSDRLVNAAWVKDLIDTKNNGKPYIIAEVGWGGPEGGYDKGHIPGAIHVNTDEIEYDYFEARDSGPVERSTTAEQDEAKGLSTSDTLPRNWWDIYPDKYLLPAFASMGIDTNTTVVVYGDPVIAAARVVWALMYAGVKDVRLLDGGYNAWTKEGYDTSTETIKRTPVADFGTKTALHPEYLVDSAYVREVVNGDHPNDVLADIRTYDEYTGKTAPYGYIPTSGRVKSAVWGQAGDTLNDMNAYLNSDNTLKKLSEIDTMWQKAGITSDKHISFYCGTAWRSSLTWFCAYMMGWKKISNFDDSWFKWSMGPDKAINPVEDDYPDLP